METQELETTPAKRGQDPNIQGMCYCDKQGKWMRSLNFYKYRDGSFHHLCKECLTMHIDINNPDTYVWILKDLDLPYIKMEWEASRAKVIAQHKKDPSKISAAAIMGRYISKMYLNKYKGKTYADSDAINAENERGFAQLTKSEEEQQEDYAKILDQKLTAGEISQAEYDTLLPPAIKFKNLQESLAAGEVVDVIVPKIDEPAESVPVDVQSQDPFMGGVYMTEDELPNIAEGLTKEDKVMLALKWGRLYKPDEWVQLEKLYQDIVSDFSVEPDADTLNTIIMICKSSLKMNVCIDTGDFDGAMKFSRIYDTLRKSANISAAQKKQKDNGAIVSCFGELTKYCENKKGEIAQLDTKNIKQDVVDTVLQDSKDYLKSLINNDPAIAREIEDYLKKKEIQEQIKAERKIQSEMTQSDMEESIRILNNLEEEDKANQKEFFGEDVE